MICIKYVLIFVVSINRKTRTMKSVIENISKYIYFSDDKTSAYIDSDDTVTHLPVGVEREEAWEEVVNEADQELSGYEQVEQEFYGSGVRQIWHKI